MNKTAYNDPKKLADARALAQSFKTGEKNSTLKNKKSRSSAQGRSADAVRSVEVIGVVPPSKRHYGGNVLEKGWNIRGVKAEAPIMKGAMDFLLRADQAPVIPAALSQEVQGDESRVTLDDQKDNDELNAEKLAELLNSFSFKESKGITDVTESGSGSILETFLALLAEHTDLLPELEDATDSCVKRSKIINGDDESDKLEAPSNDTSEATPVPIRLDQHFSKSGDSIPSPQKTSKLRPKAPAFVPSEPQVDASVHECEKNCPYLKLKAKIYQAEQEFPFTGQFNKPKDDYVVTFKPMKGLSASKWAARTE